VRGFDSIIFYWIFFSHGKQILTSFLSHFRSIDFTSGHLQQLKNSNIIPAVAPGSTTSNLTMVKPGECYFKREDGQTSFHSKLFTFIDFGTRANNFLVACGVRSAPTTDEVARMLVADPHGFYKLTGGAERYGFSSFFLCLTPF
jgi:hypothetical protein